MNLENINRKILKNEKTSHQDDTFEKKLARELLKEKQDKKLRPQEKADLLALRLSPENEKLFSDNRIKRLRELEHSISNEELLSSLIPNKHYFFLSQLREEKLSSEGDIIDLAKGYNLNKSDVQELRKQGFLDYVEDGFDIIEEYEKELKDYVKKRGFLSSLTESEKSLLHSISDTEITLDSNNPELVSLKRRGHLDILTKNEQAFLKDGAKIENLHRYDLSSSDYYRLKERIEFHIKGEVKSIDDSGLTIREKDFITNHLSTGEKESPGFSKDHAQKLIQRIERYIGQEIKGIDYRASIRLNDIYDFTAKVYYRETSPILSFREKRPLDYYSYVSAKDASIYLRGQSGEHLSKRELDRYTEIVAAKDLTFLKYVPSNTELAFLRKIHTRKIDTELAIKIGKNDFGLEKEAVYHLMLNQFISVSNGFGKNEWIEPKSLYNARVWQSTFQRHSFEDAVKILSELKLEEPNFFIKELIKNNYPIYPQQKTEDYGLFLKVHFKDSLNLSELNRLIHLRENGIHPELNYSFLTEEPSSWNMKSARKQAFIQHFKERYQINMQVIDFVNKFKQVTHDQLLKLGLSSGEIDRYVRGIENDKIPFGGKILNRHTLHTPKGKILYYSIQHRGLVSGRSLLETRLPKELIAERPQQRQDLLFHDLKVVDCVLQVSAELKEKGLKILEIKNEASQYSDAKAGKMNNWRKDGPSFMDAILIVEELDSEALSLSGGTKSIAVEYGNYTNERMMSKIENSSFDQAFVFSNTTFQQKYAQLSITQNVVFRSI
ncbi:MAG: hypothetical protein K2P81_11265 [Bacteriovoracaceae bacterium]|nr:hypothetical protein [Bacteriovoracaceae bacterium]